MHRTSHNEPLASSSRLQFLDDSISEINFENILKAENSSEHEFSEECNKDELVRVISTAISTVIMLAQNRYKEISAEQIKITENYFHALKRNGEHPRNIEQFAKLISHLKWTGEIAIELGAEEDEENEPLIDF